MRSQFFSPDTGQALRSCDRLSDLKQPAMVDHILISKLKQDHSLT